MSFLADSSGFSKDLKVAESASGIARAWQLDDQVTYLNHGSFGPSPMCVQEARAEWTRQLERQPMEFFVRRMDDELQQASTVLGDFIGADPRDLVFVDNATFGMNVVVNTVELQPGDEVLLTDHEYGAVMRIWREACRRVGAEFVVQSLPAPLTDADEVVDRLFERVTDKTRLIVMSHLTSQTAVFLPVDEICRRARERGILTCIDGPHAIACTPLNLRRTDPDFYTASCHKWLSAPFGSGFLYVRRRHQQSVRPCVTSWGRSLEGRPKRWQDEFNWIGTRDPAGFLAIPTAIQFLQEFGLDAFRETTHALARYAREKITALTGLPAPCPDSPGWYGPMTSLPLLAQHDPDAKELFCDPLQRRLWAEFHIEAPVFDWHGSRRIRVSCHLYNTKSDVDRLVEALVAAGIGDD